MGLPEYGNAHIIHARCTKEGNSSILDHNNLIKRQCIYFNSLRQLLLLVPHKSFLFKLVCVNVKIQLSSIQAFVKYFPVSIGSWTLNSLGSLLPLTTNPHAGTDTDTGMIYSEEPEQSN